MPAVVGFVKLNALAEASIFQVGDVFWTSPESHAAIYAGPGSYNIGDGLRTKTYLDTNKRK